MRLLDPSQIPLKPRSGISVWAGLLRGVKILLFLSLIALLLSLFLPVFQKEQKLQATRQKNASTIDEEIQVNRQLQKEHDLLKSNPQYLERTARDTLNVGKTGETIFRFEPYKAPEAEKKTPPPAP